MRALIVSLLLSFAAAAAPAQTGDGSRGAGLQQRLGGHAEIDVPLRLSGGAPAGERIRSLREAARGKPLLLALGYYRCPRLCDLAMDGMAAAIAGQALRPGRDFAVAFVSIDPRERSADAERQRATLARRHPEAGLARWQLFTTAPDAARHLAASLGYRYAYEAERGEYAHPAVLMVLAADGRIVQYLNGVQYQPESLRLALVQAAQGEVGSLFDQLVLLCCAYDPGTGRYSLLIDRVLLAACVATALALGGLLYKLRSGRP